MKQTVALTGANGFLGSAILQALERETSFDIVVLARSPADTARPHTPQIAVDLTEERTVAEALAYTRPHALIHAAGRVKGAPLSLFRDNVVTTISIADA